jgi:ATP-binding cassette subfamily F protein 3
LDNVSKSYDTLNVFSGINLQMNRGEKFAFLGPNGAGKTTLARMIAGEIKDYSGTIKFGHNTTISYYAQEVADSLNGEDDLLDVISSTAPDLTPGRIRNILGSFLFSDDDVFKKIKVLSGGEKSRVALAKILVTQANLIVLDEPTNHLDITSKEMLQKALIEFDGSLIIVSHDIDFLRPITDKIVEIKDGRAKLFHGDIDYYLFKSIQENAPQNNGKTISQSTSVNNRKEAKRKEAEKRQERFKATKELKQKIDKLENLIAELEEKKTTLESELAMESVYSNPTIAKEKNSEYEVVKNNLDETYRQWSELTEKLETIEKSFDY